ncbi:MAG: DUF6455 family protein [Propylenella sp.]
MGIFKRIEDHGNLMSQMIGRTGADLTNLDGYTGEATFRNAIGRCLTCSHGDECRAWLAEAEQGSAPPGFCANAALFGSLARD